MRIAERHAVAVGKLQVLGARSRPAQADGRRQRRGKARALLVAEGEHVDAERQPLAGAEKCSAARMPAITPNGPSYLPASITVSMCEPISRRFVPAPSSAPAHRAERILGDLKPGLAHPCGNAIGGAAVLGREEQPHQPVRLGRDRAERIDHRFGTRAERIDVVLGESRRPLRLLISAAQPPASQPDAAASRSFLAASKPCMPLRHCSAITAPLTGWISSSDERKRQRQPQHAHAPSRPAGRPSRHAGSAVRPDGRRSRSPDRPGKSSARWWCSSSPHTSQRSATFRKARNIWPLPQAGHLPRRPFQRSVFSGVSQPMVVR